MMGNGGEGEGLRGLRFVKRNGDMGVLYYCCEFSGYFRLVSVIKKGN